MLGCCPFREIQVPAIVVLAFIRFGGGAQVVAFPKNEVKPRVSAILFPRLFAACHRKSRSLASCAPVSGEMSRSCGSRLESRRSRQRKGLGSVLGIGRASKLESISHRLRPSHESTPFWIALGKRSSKVASRTVDNGLIPIRVGQILPVPLFLAEALITREIVSMVTIIGDSSCCRRWGTCSFLTKRIPG